jgi:hypothetical protein
MIGNDEQLRWFIVTNAVTDQTDPRSFIMLTELTEAVSISWYICMSVFAGNIHSWNDNNL